MEGFRAPRWLPGGHAQTIWPALFAKRFDDAPPSFRRERWTTPDRDFVDVDFLDARVPDDAIKRLRSVLTVVGGKVVHQEMT